MAAAPKLPDFDALAVERIRLQRRLKDVESRYERLREMVAAFPNDVTVLQERRVAEELRSVRDRIDEIDAILIPLRLG
jgi:hypothetical protein